MKIFPLAKEILMRAILGTRAIVSADLPYCIFETVLSQTTETSFWVFFE